MSVEMFLAFVAGPTLWVLWELGDWLHRGNR